MLLQLINKSAVKHVEAIADAVVHSDVENQEFMDSLVTLIHPAKDSLSSSYWCKHLQDFICVSSKI